MARTLHIQHDHSLFSIFHLLHEHFLNLAQRDIALHSIQAGQMVTPHALPVARVNSSPSILTSSQSASLRLARLGRGLMDLALSRSRAPSTAPVERVRSATCNAVTLLTPTSCSKEAIASKPQQPQQQQQSKAHRLQCTSFATPCGASDMNISRSAGNSAASNGVPQQPAMTIYTAVWTAEDILKYTAGAGSDVATVAQLRLSQDALLTLPDFGYAQVMTQDAGTSDALGFCDAEQVIPGSTTCFVLHRAHVGAPWELVGMSSGSSSACDELVPLTSCAVAELSRASSAELFSCCADQPGDLDVDDDDMFWETSSFSLDSPYAEDGNVRSLDVILNTAPAAIITVTDASVTSCSAMVSRGQSAVDPMVHRTQSSTAAAVMEQLMAPWRWAWAWCRAGAGNNNMTLTANSQSSMPRLPAQLLC